MRPWIWIAGDHRASPCSPLRRCSADPVLIQYGINALLFATLAQSWNIIGGFAGYPSFGNSVFYGLGAYGTAIAMVQFDLPFAVGLGFGALLAVLCALLVGLPVLRLQGHYFAIATLGVSAAMAAIVSNLEIAGANIGLVLPLTRADNMFFELALALLVVCVLTVAWISRSRFGMALIAIREDEDAAASMGVNTTLNKTLALVLSALFTSIAGGINAYWITFIDPASVFDLTLNVRMVIMAIFGGPGTVFGPVLGAFVLSAVYEILANWISTAAALLFGLVIVLSVIFMPRGLADLIVGLRFSGPALPHAEHPQAPAMSAAAPPPPLLEARGLTKRFQGLVSVDHVTFVLPKGEILAVIGPNGAGKTTLVNMISGTLTPDEGELSFRASGSATSAVSPRADRHRPHLSGHEAVSRPDRGRKRRGRRPLRLRGWRSLAGGGARARPRMAGFRRPRRARRPDRADSLSGPDRKRLELAKALALRPTLLLLDEVMAG